MDFTEIIFTILSVAAICQFISGLLFRWKKVRQARATDRLDRIPTRIKTSLGLILGHSRILKDRSAGFMHLLIFWGLAVFSVASVQLILSGAFQLNLPVLSNWPFFYFVSELAGVAALTGILFSAYRRYVQRPAQLGVGGWKEEKVIIGLIAAICLYTVSYFLFYAGLIAAHPDPPLKMAPISNLCAPLFASGSQWSVARPGLFWWVHAIIALGLLIYFRFSKLTHPIAAPINIFFRNLSPVEHLLQPIDFQEMDRTFGVGRLQDYTWKDLMDAYACAECGRCESQCPAHAAGKPLSSKELIVKIRDSLYDSGTPLIAENSITEEAIWSCTTCFACQETCPVFNEHINKILGLRRYLVMEQAHIPDLVAHTLRSISDRGHPWKGSAYSRTDWAEGFNVMPIDSIDTDVLYWVGCTAALESSCQTIAQAFALIMEKAGVRFKTLASAETCCGDPARKMGDEYLFQRMVKRNIRAFQNLKIRKIVTTCPHCYNTLKNEYPIFGGRFDVQHHTEFIFELLEKGKIKPRKPLQANLAYHDGCYLGRYNGIYNKPRKIIEICNGKEVVEFEKNREKSFCCGGGGGRLWMSDTTGKRISEVRVEQIKNEEIDSLITACPFCYMLFEDYIKSNKSIKFKVNDIAQIMSESL